MDLYTTEKRQFYAPALPFNRPSKKSTFPRFAEARPLIPRAFQDTTSNFFSVLVAHCASCAARSILPSLACRCLLCARQTQRRPRQSVVERPHDLLGAEGRPRYCARESRGPLEHDLENILKSVHSCVGAFACLCQPHAFSL